MGLNELGVSELNEFYKENINRGYFKKFKVGTHGSQTRTKRHKQIKSFGPETCLYTVDIKQCIEGNPYGGGYFRVRVKHVKCEIYEVELTESKKLISVQ